MFSKRSLIVGTSLLALTVAAPAAAQVEQKAFEDMLRYLQSERATALPRSAPESVPEASTEAARTRDADAPATVEAALADVPADIAAAMVALTEGARPTARMSHGTSTSLAMGILDGEVIGAGSNPLVQALAAEARSQFCYICPTEAMAGDADHPLACELPGIGGTPLSCSARFDTDATNAVVGRADAPARSPLVEASGHETLSTGLPSGYTFLGQFVDHDLTATMIALARIGQSAQLLMAAEAAAGAEPPDGMRIDMGRATATAEDFRTTLANAEPDELQEAIDKLLEKNGRTVQLDLDSAYGDVTNFGQLQGAEPSVFADLFITDNQHPRGRGRFHVRHQMSAQSQVNSFVDGFDFVRDPQSGALVADPRNDENKVIAQLHTLFLLMHNACMDFYEGATPDGESQPLTTGQAFNRCRRETPRVYQTIVATDYLPRILDTATYQRLGLGTVPDGGAPSHEASSLPTAQDVEDALELYACTDPLQIPHEFAVAAFRLGHSQLRNTYQLQRRITNSQGELLGGEPRLLFQSRKTDGAILPDLSGAAHLNRRDVIDWGLFFDIADDRTAQTARPIDLSIAETLFRMPVAALPPAPVGLGDDAILTVTDSPSEQNLARRNVKRAAKRTAALPGATSLATADSFICALNGAADADSFPSFQNIAPECGDPNGRPQIVADVHAALEARLGEAALRSDTFADGLPLWLFVIGEAGGSDRLGPVGGAIVGDFLMGALACDASSVLNAAAPPTPVWEPMQAALADGRYSMPQMITYLEGAASDDLNLDLPIGSPERREPVLFTPSLGLRLAEE